MRRLMRSYGRSNLRRQHISRRATAATQRGAVRNKEALWASRRSAPAAAIPNSEPMITAAAIVKIAPAARPYADELAAQMAESGIMANRRRASAFLGQIAVESAGFTAVMENLSYSEQRIRELAAQSRAGSRWHSLGARAKELARNPKALAEAAYGGRMGNGPEGSGDGYAYRGRTLKMLTGADNYRLFSLAWLGDESLLANPDRAAEPDGAVAGGIWFWLANGLNEIADRGDVRAVTIKVNGGTFGLRDREIWTDRFSNAWQDKPDFSNVVSGVNTVPRSA